MMSVRAFAELLGRVDLARVKAEALERGAARMAEAVREALSHSPGGAHDVPWLGSGALRDSIGQESNADGAVVGSTSSVAVYQELGTRHDPPRPFLAPVGAALGAAVAQEVGAAVAAALGGGEMQEPRPDGEGAAFGTE